MFVSSANKSNLRSNSKELLPNQHLFELGIFEQLKKKMEDSRMTVKENLQNYVYPYSCYKEPSRHLRNPPLFVRFQDSQISGFSDVPSSELIFFNRSVFKNSN